MASTGSGEEQDSPWPLRQLPSFSSGQRPSANPLSFATQASGFRISCAEGCLFDIIEAEPDRLREVAGIGPVRARRIIVAWAEQKVIREIMVFLHSHGVGTARSVRIYKTYGADAVQVMSEKANAPRPRS